MVESFTRPGIIPKLGEHLLMAIVAVACIADILHDVGSPSVLPAPGEIYKRRETDYPRKCGNGKCTKANQTLFNRKPLQAQIHNCGGADNGGGDGRSLQFGEWYTTEDESTGN